MLDLNSFENRLLSISEYLFNKSKDSIWHCERNNIYCSDILIVSFKPSLIKYNNIITDNHNNRVLLGIPYSFYNLTHSIIYLFNMYKGNL